MDFSNTSGIRSPFSPRVRQSITGRRPIGLSSAKKNQSKYMQSNTSQSGDVIYKTAFTTVETYGMPLPVMVTEALTFASSEVSVRLSPCGWCWLVTGRRVLTWPRDSLLTGSASPAPVASPSARELTLPQTDLSHKADLVVLFYEDGAHMPSCVGVSPEGTVRYWPSLAQEGAYVDVSAELAGQECERLAERAAAGLLLATTTCTLVLIRPTLVDGRATVSCRTLRPPSGWLGGIGRRFSLLIFGSMPAHAETKLVGVVMLEADDEDSEEGWCAALVAGGAGGTAGPAGGAALQLWRAGDVHEHSLRRALLDALARAHMLPHGEVSAMEMCALEVRASASGGLLLLVSVAAAPRAPDTRYAIAHISVSEAARPRVTSLQALRGWARDEAHDAPRFLPLGARALLYTENYIALTSSLANDKVDVIDVSCEGDRILGAELCNGVPLLFSKKHGVLALTTAAADSLTHTPSVCDSPMGSPCPSDMYDGNLSLYEIDPHEISTVTTDACGKLKTAFLFHLRRDVASCRAIIEELFPVSPPPAPPSPTRPGDAEREERDVDNVLDRTVLKVATEMLDDIPAGDPRWKQRAGGPQSNIALGSSAALQVGAQLRDKRRAFSLFVDFLRATGLWQRLGLVSNESGGGCKSTAAALGELAEQLTIAATLRRLQQGDYAQFIDAAVYQVVCGSDGASEEEPEVERALSSGALSPSDVCYRRVSRAGRLLRAVAAAALSAPAAHRARTLALLVTVVAEVQKTRAQWGGADGARAQPWLPAIAELHARAVTELDAKCDHSVRAQLLEAAASLADLVLSDAQHLQRSSHTQHLYDRMRRDAIQPFVEQGQIERAAALAEKFRDFELLIRLCVESDDLPRLYGYIDKYSAEGMAEIAFAWLADRGGASQALLVRELGARYPARLAAWLRAAPARAPLLALHRLSAGDCAAAAAALVDMANEEMLSVNRMMTMASLAKLCLVASDSTGSQSSDVWNKVEYRLTLGEQHSALPRDIRLHNGLDTEDTRVVPSEDLVQMYIDSESRSLTEYDYKKALDLTDYIADMERRDDLRLRVWCACIRRDEWSASGAAEPAAELQAKTFFRLIELVHLMGGDLELLLPAAEDILTAPELAELVSDARCHFLIKLAYEHLHDSPQRDLIDA